MTLRFRLKPTCEVGTVSKVPWADVVVMDAGLTLQRVFVEGEEIDVVLDA